jgi:hypothetical protein
MTRQSLDIHALIDDFFWTRFVVSEGESSHRMPCFEVIIHQLLLKSMSGSRKAGKLLMRYMNFAASRSKSGGIEARSIPDPPDELERIPIM